MTSFPLTVPTTPIRPDPRDRLFPTDRPFDSHHPRPRPETTPDPSAEEADMTVHRTRLHRHSTTRPRSTPDAQTSWRSIEPAVGKKLLARLRSEQGDVPGWVLITLMTAGIVVALWAVASDQIVRIFENAMAPFLGGSL